MSDHERLSYGRTVFISLAYFPIGLLWGVFNAFVPLILREHLTSTTAVRSVMTACSVVAAGIQPVFGGVSDRYAHPDRAPPSVHRHRRPTVGAGLPRQGERAGNSSKKYGRQHRQ